MLNGKFTLETKTRDSHIIRSLLSVAIIGELEILFLALIIWFLNFFSTLSTVQVTQIKLLVEWRKSISEKKIVPEKKTSNASHELKMIITMKS